MKMFDTVPEGTKRILSLIMRTILAFTLLIVLFQFVSIAEIRDALFAARPEYIVGAALLMIANVGIQILKWRYFVRLIDPNATSLEAAASLLFGITLGAITPGQLGEFGGRAFRHSSIAKGTIVGLTLVDKVQMMCIMGIAGVTSFVILLRWGTIPVVLTSTGAVFFFLFVFFRMHTLQAIVARFNFDLFTRPALRDLISAVSMFRPKNLIVSFGMSAGFYLVIFAQMFLLLNAFTPVQPHDAFLGFAAMMFLKSLLPISLGDLGIREASSMYFYALLGIANAAALNASLLLFTINILLPSLVGLLFIPRPRSNV